MSLPVIFALVLSSLALGVFLTAAVHLFWRVPLQEFGIQRLYRIGKLEPEWLDKVVSRGWITRWEYLQTMKRQNRMIDDELKRRQP